MLKRWLPLLFFVALGSLLFVGIRLSETRDPNAIPSPLIDKPLPAFELPTLHQPDRRIRSSELKGAPFLLNVWASWCPECRVEHPLIEQLARSGTVRVVGFNYKDEAEDAQRWLQQFGDPYAQILVDRDGRVGIDLGVYAAPENFLIDADGIVRFKHVGALTPDVIQREILPRLKAMTP
ncbi:MAG TPA: DsbE family thiol:disulfide interchange protein [Chiayiivirga sp.]|nr:DsbE family thiol:disulfide interchange protein [Chiayiivirga sp.]